MSVSGVIASTPAALALAGEDSKDAIDGDAALRAVRWLRGVRAWEAESPRGTT